jgi:hypothetical protein
MIALALSCALCTGVPVTVALAGEGAEAASPSPSVAVGSRAPSLFVEPPGSVPGAPFHAADPRLIERYYEGPPGPPWRRLLWVTGASALALTGSAAAGLPVERGFRAAGIGLGLTSVGMSMFVLGLDGKNDVAGFLVFGGALLALGGPALGVWISEEEARHEATAHGLHAAIIGSLVGGAAAAIALRWRADLERAGFVWWVAYGAATALAMATSGLLSYAISERSFAPNMARP